MRKYKVVYASMTARYQLGEYIATDKQDAKRQAWERARGSFTESEFWGCVEAYEI